MRHFYRLAGVKPALTPILPTKAISKEELGTMSLEGGCASPCARFGLHDGPIVLQDDPVVLSDDRIVLQGGRLVLQDDHVVLQDRPLVLQDEHVVL